MSVQAHAWAKRARTGSGTLKSVLVAIADYADANGRAWPSQEQLAEDTEFSVRAVRNAIVSLVEAGLVERVERRRRDGTRASDILVLGMGQPLNRHEMPVEGDQPAPRSKQPARGAGLTTFEPSGTTRLPWNRRFRPSPAEFAAEAREGVILVRTRLLHARRVLDADVIEVPTQAQRDAVAEAARAHMRQVPTGDGPGLHRRESPAEIRAARDAQIQGSVDRLREAGHGPDISRLTDHLNARRAGPQGGRAQP